MSRIRRRAVAETPPKVSKGGPKDPPDWDKWIGHRQMRRDMGLASGTIYELLKEAGISPHVSEDGTKKYPPDTIDRLRPLLLDDDAPKETVGADLVRASATLVKLSEEHNRQLVEVMVKPLQLAQSVLESSLDRLQKRCTELEAGRDAATKAREDLLSEVAAREIAAREFESTERRRDAAWGLLLARAPVLLDQVQASILGKGLDKNPAVKQQIESAIALLTSIEPKKLQALRESGFMSDEQMAHIDKILAAGKPPSPEPAKPETTNGKR